MPKKEPRKGRQTPTKYIILPYKETRGRDAILFFIAHNIKICSTPRLAFRKRRAVSEAD